MSRRTTTTVERRQFLAQATAGAVAATLPGGVFTAGADLLRVGLIGCGGRGTGAVAQALAADPGTRVVAVGDVFADQIESSQRMLVAQCGQRGACPRERRFVGGDAWRHVLAADIDLVVLASPPYALPQHLLAAVEAGVHVYCEAPVAVDVAGVHAAAAAVGRATSAGISIGSGLCYRHDPGTQGIIAAVQAGGCGAVRTARVEAHIGLPWRRPLDGLRGLAARQRNWASFADLSGGAFVEHHVHALDKALWACGDAAPVWAEGRLLPGRGADAVGCGSDGVAVRYGFADGRTIDAVCQRRAGEADRIIERVTGAAGSCDLLAGTAASSGGRFQATMTHLVRSLRSGQRVAEGHGLCRATLVAVMGRVAAETGRRIEWAAVSASPPAPPLQPARA
jgi:myo-inositol 2-dehydrogenase/D-chiro-inositol 1-dehydrogenase